MMKEVHERYESERGDEHSLLSYPYDNYYEEYLSTTIPTLEYWPILIIIIID